jgi:uncharacterized membrane protein
MAAIANPFDPKTVVLAKHAQHVVLVHFPIALFLTAVAFDFAAQRTKSIALAIVARYNFMIAAVATVPVLISGLLAWRWQLEGHKLKGVLLQHLVLGAASSLLIWVVWLIHSRAARRRDGSLPAYRLVIEMLGALMVALTAHLGGFLSGVNVPG